MVAGCRMRVGEFAEVSTIFRYACTRDAAGASPVRLRPVRLAHAGARPQHARVADPLLAAAVTTAAWFGATGAWPLLHYPSFAAITGPKRDVWLVRTVGALVCVVALAIAVAAARGDVDPTVLVLAVGTAAALGIIDLSYVARGVIARIYLAEAALEAALIAWWLLAWCAR